MPNRQACSKRTIAELVAELRTIGERRHRAALEDEIERGSAGSHDGPGLPPSVAVDRIWLTGKIGGERPEPIAGLDPAAGDPIGERAEHVAGERVRIGAGAVPWPKQRCDARRPNKIEAGDAPAQLGQDHEAEIAGAKLDRSHARRRRLMHPPAAVDGQVLAGDEAGPIRD
jgi:hypothetical protein